jgi:tRNA(Ile)-lysidine synthase
LHVERIDVRSQSQFQGENLEATGRQLRYAWLQKTAEDLKLTWIATGHHADDQAETVLHHLMRGTGLRGLRGIASFRRLNDEVTLVRPFLSVTRRQILDHLQQYSLTYRQDHTNADTDLMRSRIRHELLPWLCERFHAEVPAHLVQLAEQAQEWQEYLTAQAAILLRQVEKPRVGSLLILDQAALAAATPLMVRELFHLIWEREGWPRGEMTVGHWQRMAEVVAGKHAACELPGGLQVRCQGRVVQVGPKQQN